MFLHDYNLSREEALNPGNEKRDEPYYFTFGTLDSLFIPSPGGKNAEGLWHDLTCESLFLFSSLESSPWWWCWGGGGPVVLSDAKYFQSGDS